MKQVLSFLILMSAFAVAPLANAGIEKFNSDEFNNIISENLKAEQDLREHLRVDAGVPDVKKELHPDFAQKGRELVGVAAAEDVASPTTEHHTKSHVQADAYNRDLQRVADEVKASDEP